MRRPIPTILFILATLGCARATDAESAPWVADQGDGSYKNPVLFADYSDPDVIRVGDDYYMVSSSFNCVPALPILHSRDLVNWTLIGRAAERLPSPRYDLPRHGEGVWAPSIRHHDGWYWVFYGDPDVGCYMTRARDPRGPWEPLHLVHEALGMIDTCPLWDDDGKAYLVNGWAKSRAGFNAILTVYEMEPDGTALIGERTTVFDGTVTHPTIEGPKFYKRGDYYYIFAPFGGVATGSQTVLRASSPLGPYEYRNVLEQGSTDINGPHQGGWVTTPDGGEDWFLHFQEYTDYGRVAHLNPMHWTDDDWVTMGVDFDGNGIGEPVSTHAKPNVGATHPVAVPQTTDEFGEPAMAPQWQWYANPEAGWASRDDRPGWLRLTPVAIAGGEPNLHNQPNILLQKLPAPDFTVTTKLDAAALTGDAKAGLIVMGFDYAYLGVSRAGAGLRVTRVTCTGANDGRAESVQTTADLPDAPLFLRVEVEEKSKRPHCAFSYSADGETYTELGNEFAAREGRWIGAKVGLFAVTPAGVAGSGVGPGGHADFDFFRIQ
jgi:beta-xylosidase